MAPIKIQLAERLHGVGEYYFSTKRKEIDQLKSEGRNIISLGIGSPDLPAPDQAIKRLLNEASKPHTHGYQPYQGTHALRQAFAQWYQRYYNVDMNWEDEILPLIGSKEGIMHCCMAYLNKGDQVLIPNPGYPTYSSAVSLAGGVPTYYSLTEENDYQINFDKLEQMDLSQTKILICNYPHMPTGAKAKEGLFEQLIAFGKKHGILIIHDNPYSFIRNEKPQSLLSVKGALDCAIELNSLSKSHNMSGWRIGAIMGAKQRIEEILRFKSNMDSGMFLPIQLAAIEALSLDSTWYESLNEVYREREEIGYQIMEKLGCKALPHQAGLFIWGKLPQQEHNCFDFIDDILYNKNIFITPGAIFGSEGGNYIRISLCAPKEQLKEVLNRL